MTREPVKGGAGIELWRHSSLDVLLHKLLLKKCAGRGPAPGRSGPPRSHGGDWIARQRWQLVEGTGWASGRSGPTRSCQAVPLARALGVRILPLETRSFTCGGRVWRATLVAAWGVSLLSKADGPARRQRHLGALPLPSGHRFAMMVLWCSCG